VRIKTPQFGKMKIGREGLGQAAALELRLSVTGFYSMSGISR
jgi:hypothetical protein